MLTFHIITLFPESFKSYLSTSILSRAIKQKKVVIKFYNPRDFTRSKTFYKQTDAKPYGGGPGMVMQAEPVLKAVARATQKLKPKTYKLIIFSPSGAQFTNKLAGEWAGKYQHLILICGRYEGIDARVKKVLKAQEVSVGPYVLTGGELPAMVVVDTASRQVEGVLGKFDSVEERRVASSEVYTRPEVLVYKKKKYKVPKVLLSGNHQKIEAWRLNP